VLLRRREVSKMGLRTANYPVSLVSAKTPLRPRGGRIPPDSDRTQKTTVGDLSTRWHYDLYIQFPQGSAYVFEGQDVSGIDPQLSMLHVHHLMFHDKQVFVRRRKK
jgi:hypothetical protein